MRWACALLLVVACSSKVASVGFTDDADSSVVAAGAAGTTGAGGSGGAAGAASSDASADAADATSGVTCEEGFECPTCTDPRGACCNGFGQCGCYYGTASAGGCE